MHLFCDRIVLPDRVVEGGAVAVSEGRIQRIGPLKTPPSKETAIELRDCTLYPGFVDIHIHGAHGVDTLEADKNQLHSLSVFLASQGVTSWLPTLVPAPNSDYTAAIQAITESMSEQANAFELKLANHSAAEAYETVGARVLGVHYEGPFVNELQCGALRTEYFKTLKECPNLDQLPVPDLPAVRMMTVAPEIDRGIELIKELKERNWTIAIGHTRADLQVLDNAYQAGARHMTHFMNAMPPMHHRAPGPIGWGLSRDEVTLDLIADGVHLDPFMVKLILSMKSAGRVSLISDAISATGLGDGKYKIWGEIIEVAKGRTKNARGSIAGSVITMLDAVRMMSSLKVPERAIAQMAATNPASVLGMGHECGSIEEGKRADLVALDSEGNVQLTLVGGAVAYKGPLVRI